MKKEAKDKRAEQLRWQKKVIREEYVLKSEERKGVVVHGKQRMHILINHKNRPLGRLGNYWLTRLQHIWEVVNYENEKLGNQSL